MKRALALAASVSLAIIPTATLHAEHHRFAAVAAAPRAAVTTRSFNAGRSFAAAPRTFFQRGAIPQRNFGAVTANRSSSFAFGGHPYTRSATVVSPYNRYVQPNVRSYWSGNRFAYRTPPAAAVRSWDRHGDHTWNHHRYRWGGNSWVIIDGGYGYPYGGYGYPYAYYDDGYYSTPDVMVSTAPAEDSLAAEVQQALAAQGYYHDAIDGDIGPLTRAAIAAYQRDHRLPVTGTINAPLLDSLGLE